MKKQARIDALVEGNTREELQTKAEEAGLDTTGTKSEIATRLVEAGAHVTVDEEPSDTSEEAPELSTEERLAKLEQDFKSHTHGRVGEVIVPEPPAEPEPATEEAGTEGEEAGK